MVWPHLCYRKVIDLLEKLLIFQSVHIYAELGNCYEFLISLFSKSINGMGREKQQVCKYKEPVWVRGLVESCEWKRSSG